jgi:ribosomal protein L28
MKRANLRNKKLQIEGRRVRVIICASCLKRLNKDIKEENAALAKTSE